MINTAIYGGSFNPPTLAHSQVVTEVINKTNIDTIILTPSGERSDKNHYIDNQHRGEMIQLFYDSLIRKGIAVELDTHFFEGNNGGYTTTVDEEKYFREKLGYSPFFIYGSDIAENMPEWSGNTDQFIEKKLKKIFISRPGYTFEPQKHGINNFYFLDIPNMPNISSSLAREMIKQRKNINHILLPEIESYIASHNIYRK